METIAKIRLLYHVTKKSVSEIARQFRLSRNTIYKYLHYEGDVPKYARRSSAKPQLGPHEAILQQWVETELHLPRKQRRTARRLFDLRKEGYTGAYDSVQRWVKHWRAAEHPGVQKAYIPLVFRPGEAYQFDWSTEMVILGGVACRVKVAHFRLTHSRMSFVRAYPRETQEMVFAAHQEAFAALGGVPRARDLRQPQDHRPRGVRPSRRGTGSGVQPPVPGDDEPLSHRPHRRHGGGRLGEGAGRESGGYAT